MTGRDAGEGRRRAPPAYGGDGPLERAGGAAAGCGCLLALAGLALAPAAALALAARALWGLLAG